ncbi:hypothetical protein BLA29_012589, partial [Euroglyphus maynei]
MNTKPQPTKIVVNSSDNGKYPQSSSSSSYMDNRENRIYCFSKYQHRQPQQQQINANIKKQITIQQPPPSSSPLRSSRSFTASYCSRPNVT